MSTDPNDKPTYYRTDMDVNALRHLEDFNRQEAVWHPTDQPVDPLSEDAVEGWEIRAARATPEELAAWRQAYDRLVTTTDTIQADLDAARAAWEKAQEEATAALSRAYGEYRHVHDTIDQRHEEVQELRDQADEERQAAADAEAAARQAAEDAELGPRSWLIYEPNSSSVKVAPDMMVPVIHLAGCPTTKRARDHRYVAARKAEVETVLLAGAPRYERGMPTPDRLPTKLCGRCKPGDSLHQALGHVYETWRDQVESVQEPAPKPEATAAALKLRDEWRTNQIPGYTRVSDQYQRAEKLIETHEFLVGWYDPDRKSVIPNPEALERLEEILPGRGWAVRRIKEPQAFRVGDKWSDTGVAVRRMTKMEIRQRKEGAAPAAVVDLEGGDG
jgi:hypothetical protein